MTDPSLKSIAAALPEQRRLELAKRKERRATKATALAVIAAGYTLKALITAFRKSDTEAVLKAHGIASIGKTAAEKKGELRAACAKASAQRQTNAAKPKVSLRPSHQAPIAEAVRLWDGNDWEARIQLLLKRRYKLGDYQEVPARHKGDLGIEGFSRPDAHAYQCYAAYDFQSIKKRYENQRDKMTEDIGKFIAYKQLLSQILHPIKIRHWIFAVPHFDSRDLILHAAKKSKEVRALRLPYVDSRNFQISIVDEDFFAVERSQLLAAGAVQLNIGMQKATRKSVDAWSKSNGALAARVKMKIQDHPNLSAQSQRNELYERMVSWYLEGLQVASFLQNNEPHLYEELEKIRYSHEQRLMYESIVGDTGDSAFLLKTLKELTDSLSQSLNMIPQHTIDSIARGAIADWLAQCPMKFKSGS